MVETRFRKIINKILDELRAKGRQIRLRDLKIYIVFLLRLRQGAAHPFLLEPVLKKTLRKSDLLEIKVRLQQVGGEEPVFKRIGKWCAKKATTMRDNTTGRDQETFGDTFGNSKFGYEFDMENQIEIALASKEEDVCRLCYQEPLNTCVTTVSWDCSKYSMRDIG